MTPDDRIVAGLHCSTVLAELSAYLDHELPPERRSAIEAHVSACDVCATFGAEFTEMVRQVRESLAIPDSVSDAVAARLRVYVDRTTQ